METVEIVIKLPKEIIDHVKKFGSIFYTEYIVYIAREIQECTPLPKGHGRLIDADAIITEAKGKMKYPLNYKYMECIIAHMNLASTIIEADKEVENDNKL